MNEITHESQSVLSYLNMMQGVINRMAANSASCKTWCITLVSALVLIIANIGNSVFLIGSIIPIIVFFFLDSFYLGLEKQFRDLYNSFVEKVHSNQVTVKDLFVIYPGTKKDILCATYKSFSSMAIWPFYGLLLLMLLIINVIFIIFN